jgi:hypothetical protein
MLSVTANAPILQLEIRPATAALGLTTFTSTLVQLITPITTNLLFSALAPSLRETTTPAVTSLILSTFAPSITAAGNVAITPTPATLALIHFTPWLFAGHTPANRTFVVEFGNYEVEVGAGNYELTVSAGEYEEEPETQLV